MVATVNRETRSVQLPEVGEAVDLQAEPTRWFQAKCTILLLVPVGLLRLILVEKIERIMVLLEGIVRFLVLQLSDLAP
jgi:hypothetical protein